MLAITSKQSQIMIVGSGSDKNIRIADNLTFSPQIATDTCKLLHDRAIEGKHIYGT